MSSSHLPVADADLVAAVDLTSASIPLTATEKGLLSEIAKRRFWARNTFRYQDGKLYANVSKTHALARDEENKH